MGSTVSEYNCNNKREYSEIKSTFHFKIVLIQVLYLLHHLKRLHAIPHQKQIHVSQYTLSSLPADAIYFRREMKNPFQLTHLKFIHSTLLY